MQFKPYIKDLTHFVNSVKYIFKQKDLILPPTSIDSLVVFYQWCEQHYYYCDAPSELTRRLKWYHKDLSEYEIEQVKKEIIDEITFSGAIGAFSQEFEEQVRTLIDTPGVYFLYSLNKSLLYIGRSVNLPSRVISSLNERKKGHPRFVEFLPTKTKCDAAILEAYFIGKEKPPMNGDMAFADSITVDVSNIPQRTKMIQIFHNYIDKPNPQATFARAMEPIGEI